MLGPCDPDRSLRGCNNEKLVFDFILYCAYIVFNDEFDIVYCRCSWSEEK